MNILINENKLSLELINQPDQDKLVHIYFYDIKTVIKWHRYIYRKLFPQTNNIAETKYEYFTTP